MRTAARPGTRKLTTSPSHATSWIVASLVAVNVAACAALEAGVGGDGSGGGAGWTGATTGSATGGTIDYDASTGAGGGDYAALCGRGACDPREDVAVSSCEGLGGGSGNDGGSGGAARGNGGSGGAGGGGAGVGGDPNGAGVGGGPGVGGDPSGPGGGGVGGSAGVGGDPSGAGVGGVGGSAGIGGAGVGGVGGSAGAGGDPSGAGVGGIGGIGGSAGIGGDPGGAGGMAMGGASGTGGASSGSGGSGAGGGPAASVVECKVVLSGEGPARACVASGAATELSPCTTAADCGPGLGCVLVSGQGTGVCREYCCGDVEACPRHTYCAPRPMAEAGDDRVAIPVCVDADDCTLLEEGQCPEGLMCAVVRADGTTACVQPGNGKQGDRCPCAPGFACSKLVDECRQICHTSPQNPGNECPVGFECQGNSSLPEGFGLCVMTGGF